MGTLLQVTGCIPAFSTRGKGALGPLLSAPAGASKRETPTSNLTESTAPTRKLHKLFITYGKQCLDYSSVHKALHKGNLELLTYLKV